MVYDHRSTSSDSSCGFDAMRAAEKSSIENMNVMYSAAKPAESKSVNIIIPFLRTIKNMLLYSQVVGYR